MRSRMVFVDEVTFGDRRARRIEIRRAERANSLTVDLMNMLADAIRGAGDSPIVLTARGTNFCAGLDLYELAAALKREQSPRRLLDPLLALYTALLEHSAPTICLVNGAAVAGGLGLAAAIDHVIATDAAYFSIPARIPQLARIPAAIAHARIPSIEVDDWIGWRASARQSHQVGLVSRVVPAEDARPIEALLAEGVESDSASPSGFTVQSNHRFAALASLTSELGRAANMAEFELAELARSVEAVISRWSYRRGESCRMDWSASPCD